MTIHTKKEISTSTDEKEILCRQCDELALCNRFDCYKKKLGTMNCTTCDERLCQHNWRVYFRKNVKC
jgi:hypothetical protein